METHRHSGDPAAKTFEGQISHIVFEVVELTHVQSGERSL
jgi:hypothetical protein